MYRKNISLAILRILLGVVLIFSGVVKLYPIEPFELNFIDIGIANWITAPIIARGLIAIEIFLGIILICNWYAKKAILPAIIVLLHIFSFYLIWYMVEYGNQGNCGCFGAFLEMTPLESLLKNLFMLVVAFILVKWNVDWFWRYQRIAIYVLTIVALCFPFIVNPPDFVAASRADIKNVGYKFDTKYLGEYNFSGQKPDFSKGKSIVAFFLTTCPHCRIAALKLSVLKRKYKLPPVYAVITGKPQKLQEFLTESRWDLPYYYYSDKNIMKLSGTDFPAIFYIQNGIVITKWNHLMMNEEDMQKILK